MPRPSCLIHLLSVYEPCIGTVALDSLGSQFMLMLPLGASKFSFQLCQTNTDSTTVVEGWLVWAHAYGIQNSAVRDREPAFKIFWSNALLC